MSYKDDFFAPDLKPDDCLSCFRSEKELAIRSTATSENSRSLRPERIEVNSFEVGENPFHHGIEHRELDAINRPDVVDRPGRLLDEFRDVEAFVNASLVNRDRKILGGDATL